MKRKETGILAVMSILSIIAGIIVVIITAIEFIDHNMSFGSTGIGIALGVILIAMGFVSRT